MLFLFSSFAFLYTYSNCIHDEIQGYCLNQVGIKCLKWVFPGPIKETGYLHVIDRLVVTHGAPVVNRDVSKATKEYIDGVFFEESLVSEK